MRSQDEEFQVNNGAGQNGKWTRRLEVVIPAVLFILVTVLAVISLPDSNESAQWLIVYGVTTYVLAIIATLSVRAVTRMHMQILKLVIVCLLFYLMSVPTLFGSVAFVYALYQLLGKRVDGSAAILTGILWASVSFSLIWLGRRIAPRA